MGKRRGKGRSVRKNPNIKGEPEEIVKAPHSFVIHRGLPGGHIVELTKDFRKVMEPFTATSLKERKKNTVKDFVAVAGPLHVSHLCIFTQTEIGMYFKICRLPRGPTLTFKVHNFSLARDVVSSLKKQMVVEEAFKHSPLIILNSFSGEGMQMKLMASMFQNMFPTINVTAIDLNTVRRCVLMSYNSETKLIDFRHYNIKVVPVGISKAVKKITQGKVPNLAKCDDISHFLTKSGILSESEAEDDPKNHVTLSQKLISRGNVPAGKSAIRLSELGPRMSLQLIKIEDGLLDGEVLYHDLIHKSDEEKEEIRKKREAKKKLKEKRKKVQEQNKKRKELAKQDLKEKSLEGMQKAKTESNDKIPNKQHSKTPVTDKNDDDDDAEYYRKEIGEEPDEDLFKNKGTKRPFIRPYGNQKVKKMKLDSKQENKRENFKTPSHKRQEHFKTKTFNKSKSRNQKRR